MSGSRPSPMNRRHFLQWSGSVAVSAALPGSATVGPPAPDEHAVGIQLYMMQTPLVHDFDGTLAELGRIGYRQAEVVGLLGHDARTFRRALDAAGLSSPSAHIFSKAAQDLLFGMAAGRMRSSEAWAKIRAAMDLARIEPIMEEMFTQTEVLGNEYLVLAVVDETLFGSHAGMDRIVAAFNKAGDMCHQRRLKFAFHPHLADFSRMGGVSAVDRILDATDPDRVFVELDFFWAAMANVDVPRLLHRHSGRFRLGHAKDMAKDVVVPADGFKDLGSIAGDPFEDVGYGQLDYRRWIPLGRKAGIRHFFVERDQAPDPLENARRSFQHAKALLS